MTDTTSKIVRPIQAWLLSAVLDHVYDGRTCVYVSLPSGERIPATDVRYDKQTDDIIIDTASKRRFT